MAARENQGYLIAIILLVLLTVILAILTYFAFSQATAMTSQNLKLQEDLNTSNSRLTAYTEQAGILKAYVGVQSFSMGEVGQRMESLQRTGANDVIDETNSIKEIFDTDMARYTKVQADDVEKNYRGLLTDFGTSMMQKHRQITQLNNSVELAEQEKNIELESKDKEIEQVRVQLDKARKDYNDEVTRHNTSKETLGNELKSAKDENKQLNLAFDRDRSTWSTEKNGLQKERNDLASKVGLLEDRLKKYESKRIELVDGRIVEISPEINKVYVDIGSADRLQPRQSFVIFDQGLDTFERGKHKAKIEITKILGLHSAEARVVEQDNINPILRGDLVMTSTWDRGYSVPVALAGRFDLDGDGRSDLERLISMIRLNGGNVVAYEDENGKVQGKIDENTRFLVLGRGASRSSKLMDQANDFEVQPISVIEYLNSLGIRLESRLREGTGSLGVGDFEPRQPPRNDNRSAFEGN